MSEDVKTLVSDMGHAFEEFKKSYDQKLENVEKGVQDTTLDGKITALEAKLDQYEDVNQRIKASAATQDAIKEQMDRMETVMRRPNGGFTDKQIDAGVKAFDSYCRKGMEGITPDEKKALTVSNDTTGGYLAPPEYIRELIKNITEISPIRGISRVRQTGQRSIQIPKRTGTFAAQWVSEAGTRSETTGWQVGLEEIPAHEMYALVDISEQDLEDSVFNLEAEMQSEFTEQFAKAEGLAFVSGNAVGKPEGILTNASVAESNSGSGTLLTADGLITMVHAIKSDYSRNGTFVFNRGSLAAIRKLKDAAGQYVFQAGMSLSGNMSATILGHSYVEATDMPSIAGGNFPVAFGDFRRGYLIVDRVAMAVLRDPFTQANTGNIRYIARRRVGGQVILPEAIIKQKIAV
tara:strand:- start:997 stop:2211 length:1215 start_codon:yes stop_codon:yes gene_type:complete